MTQIYTLSAGRKLDRATIAEANAAAVEKTAAAAVVQAQAEAQIAALRRQELRDIRAESATDKATARARRRARVRAVVEVVRERRDFALVTGVMTASVGTAWPAQTSFYLGMGMHPVLAVLVTAMTEGSAWAGAAMASKAIEDQRPAGMYRAITWGSAVTAGALNVAHTIARSVPLAVVLGIASMLGVLLWEAYAHSRTHTRSGKSGAQVRADLYRRARYRRVHRRMRDLIAAVPGLDEGAAWVIAWRSVHGADPGVTHRTLKAHRKAAARIAGLLAGESESDAESGPESVGLTVLQSATATLADEAPGGTVVESRESVRDAESFALAASEPIEHLIGLDQVADAADESGEQSGSDQSISDDSPQNDRYPSRIAATPRRSTGPVPPSAKSTAPRRSAAELLASARDLTADWPTDQLTADRIRKAVRTSSESARMLRDALRAERDVPQAA
ncbi:hypothetical protein [Yinghuangia seranimata]|uniref:hypothetical protein n=1 Tax=Yinghuangia seranimata TaxID=408067 RepID=UPI00248AEA6C|nr:hypothetical protein [Yinghuangia seranimata]MDI2127800.1 hypothetical protein [Yinghuangia seranimata]